MTPMPLPSRIGSGSNCCFCIGTCAHSGPHSYCALHGGAHLNGGAGGLGHPGNISETYPTHEQKTLKLLTEILKEMQRIREDVETIRMRR